MYSQHNFIRRRSSDSPTSTPSTSRKTSIGATSTFDALEEAPLPLRYLNVSINRLSSGFSNSVDDKRTDGNMTSTPPNSFHIAPENLSLFVLLPVSTHSNHPAVANGPPPRPSPLKSRQSGSTIPSLKTLSSTTSINAEPARITETAEIDRFIDPGRRFSLAPGLGSGIQPRSAAPRLEPITAEELSSSPASGSGSPSEASRQESVSPLSSRPPAFGSKPATGGPSTGGRGRRRPQTAQTGQGLVSPAMGPTFAPFSRGSIAVSHGRGFHGGSVGRTRPGWEGDEVVGMLRGGGMEGELHATFHLLRHHQSSFSFSSYHRVSFQLPFPLCSPQTQPRPLPPLAILTHHRSDLASSHHHPMPCPFSDLGHAAYAACPDKVSRSDVFDGRSRGNVPACL